MDASRLGSETSLVRNMTARRLPLRIQCGVEMARAGMPGTVLEIGCGAGLACAPLVEDSAASCYVGIDRSAVAEKRFRQRNSHLIEAGRSRFVRADFLEPPGFVDATVALAINVNAFWANWPGAFSAVRRMVRAEALLILVFDAPSDERAASIAAVLDASNPPGFSANPDRPIPHGRIVARQFRYLS